MTHRAWNAAQGGGVWAGQLEQFESAYEIVFDFQSLAVTIGSATPQRAVQRLISDAITQFSSSLQLGEL